MTMKYPRARYQTDEEKYQALIREHTTEAEKFEDWARKCRNPATKASLEHSAKSSREAAKREQGNLERERARQAGIPVQATLMEMTG